jgi:NitT/TauT family transport system substrate-binding protein
MRLKPGAKIFLAIVVLVLLGAGAYRMGLLKPVVDVVAPERKPQGNVTSEDFDFSRREDTSSTTTTTPSTTPGGKLNRPIRVAIVLWGGYAGGIVANNGFAPNKDSVFFKDHGIEVELVQIDDFAESRNAFRAGGDNGGVDIMWDTVDAYALEYSSLADLRPVAIMQYDWSRGGDAIAVASGINSATDLKGKKISVAEATPSHFFLLYMLAQAGLSPNDVKLVFTNSAIEAANVFKAGKVDACVSWSPDVYMAAEGRQGARILASTREATHLIADIFVARGDFAERYPQELAGFVTGWLKGVDMANSDPDHAAQMLFQGFDGIKIEDAEGMLADVKLPNSAENLEFFELAGNPVISYDELFTAASKIWKKVGLVEQVVRPEVTRNLGFLEAASKAVPVPETEVVAAAEEFEFEPATAQVKETKPIVTKQISVYFATGSASLDDNAKAVLKDAAEFAQTFGSAYIRVSGNTDNVGSREMNLKLSKQRAQAVVNHMVNTYGFPYDKFIVVGNGPDKPVADNKTDAGKAKNRRTDFEVLPQEQE